MYTKKGGLVLHVENRYELVIHKDCFTQNGLFEINFYKVNNECR